MLLAIRLGSFLVPVNDGLVGDAVLVVQDLQIASYYETKGFSNRQHEGTIPSIAEGKLS